MTEAVLRHGNEEKVESVELPLTGQ